MASKESEFLKVSNLYKTTEQTKGNDKLTQVFYVDIFRSVLVEIILVFDALEGWNERK